VLLRDPAALRAWLAGVKDNIEDLASAGEDATRPSGRRALGRKTARAHVVETRKAAKP
jgi:hypothetical protein